MKINTWDPIKIKSFYTTKAVKIFANDVTHKGLISKIYKQLIQLNIKINQPSKQTTQSKNGQKT